MTANPPKSKNPSFDEQVTALSADWAAMSVGPGSPATTRPRTSCAYAAR